MHSIEQNGYQVNYDSDKNSVIFRGCIDQESLESCKEILHLVEDASEDAGYVCSWDFTDLEIMSGAAQSQLYHYLIKQQQNSVFKLQIKGREQSSWQQKFLPNAKRILPKTKLFFM